MLQKAVPDLKVIEIEKALQVPSGARLAALLQLCGMANLILEELCAAAAALQLLRKASQKQHQQLVLAMRTGCDKAVRQPQYSALDSFSRLEICEFVELRKLSAGEAAKLAVAV